MPENTLLKSTALLEVHQKLKARIVPFAGWRMPIQYAGVVEEHRVVREAVGIFDVSHMGEIDVRGPQAREFLQYMLTNDVDALKDGGILYSLMCYENGGVVDDLLVHRFAEDRYFLCVNAANTDKDFEWIQKHVGAFDVKVENTSAQTAQLAIQGPQSEPLLQKLCDVSLSDLKYYNFLQGQVEGVPAIIARTGYTGEDGFEIYFDTSQAVVVMEALLEAGQEFGVQPVGLGARDTLRLEMGYALYGQEISAESSPLEARLGWIIKLDKSGPFIGSEALRQQKEAGPSRRLAAIKLLARGVPRSHYRVLYQDQGVGEVTSGTFSPSLNLGVAMCYLPKELSKVGTQLEVEIRNQTVPAEVVALPLVPSRVKK